MHRKTSALAAILLVAVCLRVWGIGFGLPFANARPDETSVAGPAVGMLTGDLRPPSFNKPTLFVYAVSAAYAAYFVATSPFSDYVTMRQFAESRRQNIAPFLYISRALSAAMGVLAVWWLYGLARRATGDEAIALASAAFLAVAFLPVRDSHFGVTDISMSALVVLAVREIVAWRQSGLRRRAVIAGLIGGLAMSVKYNGLGIVVPFAVATVLSWRDGLPGQSTSRALALDGSLFTLALAATFVGGSPFVLIDWSRFLGDISTQGGALATGHGIVMARGWWHHAVVTLPASVGWPLYLTGLAGAVTFVIADFRRAAVVLAFPIAYYIVAGNGYTVFARYMLPVIPFLCLAAAWLIVKFWHVAVRRYATPAIIASAALVSAPSAVRSIRADYVLSQTDNRVLVANAIATLVQADESFYQSGAIYGRIQVPAHITHVTSDYQTLPDWVLVQRSPLPVYSELPGQLLETVQQRYAMVRSFPSADERDRLYDQQDAFFLPLTDFAGVVRPGPSFELYHRQPR